VNLTKAISDIATFKVNMNMIYEHQMIQALAYIDNKAPVTAHELFII
jgi:hypothetical protein